MVLKQSVHYKQKAENILLLNQQLLSQGENITLTLSDLYIPSISIYEHKTDVFNTIGKCFTSSFGGGVIPGDSYKYSSLRLIVHFLNLLN